jgi:hypothetical protein
MDAPIEEFYSKPEAEVWIVFDFRGSEAKNHLLRERRAWGSRATLKFLGYGRVVMMVRPGGARGSPDDAGGPRPRSAGRREAEGRLLLPGVVPRPRRSRP